jgi:two-component system, NtrC family, sensor histidine kinase HydH
VSSSAPNPGDFSLPRRLGWATAARLLLIASLFAVVVAVNIKSAFDLGSFTIRVALWTVTVAFGLSAAYGLVLRRGRYLSQLVTVQLVLDQAIWTVIVYLSGGAVSGAISFYGITCLLGAVLGGFRGATIAAVAAFGFYLLLVTGLRLGYIVAPPDQPAAAYQASDQDVLYSVVATALMLVVVSLLSGSLSERLRITGGQLVKAEARATQAEREALIGRLAMALAHEIRNPLSSISGSIRLLQANRYLSDDDHKLCEIIEREAFRLDDLVSDMVNVAKPKKPQVAVVDVAAIAQDVVNLAKNSGRGLGDVLTAYEGEIHANVMADAAMVRQMLWNLVRNAVQASQAGDIVKVGVYVQDDECSIEVVDYGMGIGDEAKEQIFDAFYTTRSHGTGIGLAVVKRIVDDHGWSVEVQDSKPRGATFCVRLGVPAEQPLGTVPAPPATRWTLSPR